MGSCFVACLQDITRLAKKGECCHSYSNYTRCFVDHSVHYNYRTRSSACASVEYQETCKVVHKSWLELESFMIAVYQNCLWTYQKLLFHSQSCNDITAKGIEMKDCTVHTLKAINNFCVYSADFLSVV